MLIFRVGLLFAVAINTPCASAANIADPEDSTVLMAALSPCESDADVVLVGTTLSVNDLREPLPQKAARLSLDEGYSQALGNLRTRDPASVTFPSGFDCPRLKLVERSAVASVLEHGDWQSFRRTFPGVVKLMEISLPGYNRAHDRAVVEVSMTCGINCGSDDLIELRRVNGKWERVTVVEDATS
jgi:hypothetical protein